MAESKPRELTAAELALLTAPPPGGADSAPLTVPPGTQVPVHLIDPAASVAAPGAALTQAPPGPTQAPPGKTPPADASGRR